MGTSYLEIYDRFLRKITDFNLPQLDDSTLQMVCKGYMDNAIPKFRSALICASLEAKFGIV